jgi:hypothetical protein
MLRARRSAALIVALLVAGALVGVAGAQEDEVAADPDSAGPGIVVEAEGPEGRASSGDGWELRRCSAASTQGNGVVGNKVTDRFFTTDRCMSLRLYSPLVTSSTNYRVFVLDPNGDPTDFCEGQGPCRPFDIEYVGMSQVWIDVFWYITDASRPLGTYTVYACTLTSPVGGSCDRELMRTTFRVLPSVARFYSEGPQDGWVLERKENAEKGKVVNAGASTLRVGDAKGDRQYRSFLHFDTSGLPDGAVITKVLVKVKRQGVVGSDPFTELRALLVDVKRWFFGANAKLVRSDFQAKANKNAVGKFKPTPKGGWYTAKLSSKAFGFVNPKGTTQLRLRFKRDDNDDGANDFLKLYSGNVGMAKRPVLIVYYYVP